MYTDFLRKKKKKWQQVWNGQSGESTEVNGGARRRWGCRAVELSGGRAVGQFRSRAFGSQDGRKAAAEDNYNQWLTISCMREREREREKERERAIMVRLNDSLLSISWPLQDILPPLFGSFFFFFPFSRSLSLFSSFSSPPKLPSPLPFSCPSFLFCSSHFFSLFISLPFSVLSLFHSFPLTSFCFTCILSYF